MGTPCGHQSLWGGGKNVDFTETDRFEVDPQSVKYFTLSANTIIVVSIGGETCFFRECLTHEKPDIYLAKHLERFMQFAAQGTSTDNFQQDVPIRTKFNNDEIESFKTYIQESRYQCSQFYARMMNADIMLAEEGFSLYHGKLMVSEAGLKSAGLLPYHERDTDILAYFLSYMGGAVACHRWNRNRRIGDKETFAASRSLASYEVARKLGLESLLVSTMPACLKIRGQELFGVLCKKAIGLRAQDTDSHPTVQLQRNLAHLQLLDALCFQTDHGPNNYNIDTDTGRVQAFDNDNMWTFWVNPSVRKALHPHCAPIINQQEEIALPHVDKSVAERFLALDSAELLRAGSPYLNHLQLWALLQRFHRLQRAIVKTSKARPGFLVDSSGWTEQSLKAELAGKYGHTYLWLYANGNV